MNKKYLKKCIAFLLVVTMLSCGAVSASAYNPLVTIKSSDWTCSDSVTAYEYPKKILIGDDEDAFRQYDELYGETCFFSTDDESVTLDKVDVQINPDDYVYDGFYFFTYYNGFYLVNFNPDAVVVALDSEGHLSFYPVYGDDETADVPKTAIYFYTALFPFNCFNLSARYIISISPTGREYEMGNWIQPYTTSPLNPVYSTVDVHERVDIDVGSVIYEADEPITNTLDLSVELYKPYKLFSGAVSFSMSAAQIQQFALGRYAFLFDNLGFINGYDSLFSFVYFQMNIYDDENQLCKSVPLLDKALWDAVGMTGATEALPAYSANIADYVIFWENDLGDLDSGTYTCMIAFVFLCDTYAAFFPGTIDIVEFDNYEDDVEHDDVLNAVDEAASVISGEISSASSALSQEIVNAASDIKDSINNSSAEIVTAVGEASSELSDKLEDVKDSIDDSTNKISDKLGEVKDGITNKLTEVKDNLLDGIKSFFIPSDEVMEEIDDKWDELLKSRFGALYEVSDIITDFASEMSWDYVKQAGEKSTITMPSVTVKLVDTDFTFGGYEVKVVPDGFDVLITALKGITSIVCTLLFVNALRRKYDKLVGGGSA